MAKTDFTLMDFVKRQGLGNIIGIFGEECQNEDGTIMSFADQAAVITHYLKLQNSGKFVHTYEKKGEQLFQLWREFIEGQSPDKIGGMVAESSSQYMTYLFNDVYSSPFPPQQNPRFTFIDLFAGIGGFRLAMQGCGGECVFSSEWDDNAKHTYFHNFGEVPFGDITKESNKQMIPDGFDVLCAGFPCQAFSIAGYRKGFEDTRGTLFFDVAEIIRRKRPKAVYLENVKNLYTHDNGNTFTVIKQTLEDLGYVVYHKVMNAMDYANVPQNRERIFIVCFDPLQVPNHAKFSFPEKENLTKTIADCIDYSTMDNSYFYTETFPHYEQLVNDMKSKDTIYQWRRQYVRENKSNVCPTLTANMGTGGHNVPLILTDNGIRKLTPKECINFQGYPEEYSFPSTIAKSAMYKQAGNSVVVPLIAKVCKQIVSVILANL